MILASWHHYWDCHAQALRTSLKQLRYNPATHGMTVVVIAIALALPVGVHALLHNARHVLKSWEGSAQISLFLHLKSTQRPIDALRARLRADARIINVHFISRSQALAEFQAQMGLTNILAALPDNPLPAVLVITPRRADTTPARMKQLVTQLRQEPLVAQVRWDRAWAQRLQHLMHLGQRTVLLLGVLLGLGVFVIIGNTIRMAVLHRRAEIEVMQLVGASRAFTRRPFIYMGAWYGLSGTWLALMIYHGAFWWLAAPLRQLALSYHSHYQLHTLPYQHDAVLLLLGTLLGITGAWCTANRQLKATAPD